MPLPALSTTSSTTKQEILLNHLKVKQLLGGHSGPNLNIDRRLSKVGDKDPRVVDLVENPRMLTEPLVRQIYDVAELVRSCLVSHPDDVAELHVAPSREIRGLQAADLGVRQDQSRCRLTS